MKLDDERGEIKEGIKGAIKGGNKGSNKRRE